MGWTFAHKRSDEPAKDWLLRNTLNWNNQEATSTYRVLASAIVNLKEFYAAVERTDKASGKREVFALVFLLAYHPQDEYNFGYKDMDETMLPYYFNCPESILDLLTPTDNDNANKWRDSCRQRIANAKAMKPGVTIEYASRRYVIESIRKGGKLLLRGVLDGVLYGMSRQRAREAKVIA